MIECYNSSPEQIIQALRDRITRRSQPANGDEGSLPDELRDQLADCWKTQDRVGKINPRGPGFLNNLIQGGKRLMGRSLAWYTRSFHPFHVAVTESVHDLARAQQDLRHRSIAADQRFDEVRRQLAAAEEQLIEVERAQRETTAELRRQLAELSERLRQNELKAEQFTPRAVAPSDDTQPVREV